MFEKLEPQRVHSARLTLQEEVGRRKEIEEIATRAEWNLQMEDLTLVTQRKHSGRKKKVNPKEIKSHAM